MDLDLNAQPEGQYQCDVIVYTGLYTTWLRVDNIDGGGGREEHTRLECCAWLLVSQSFWFAFTVYSFQLHSLSAALLIVVDSDGGVTEKQIQKPPGVPPGPGKRQQARQSADIYEVPGCVTGERSGRSLIK
ncbi:unnamed protein product [Lota lota]